MEIGMLVKPNSKGQTPVSKIKRNNRTYTNKAEISDQFHKHFVNVGQKNWKLWWKSNPIHTIDSSS